ncbi:MAG: Trk system potassium transporter TrkA [Rhodobacteraceae bacterium]|nr:Trk system potassium transporter TrkA [Paracoccaceae bacterium]
MKVIVCGAGQVGWQIARHLSGENNDVTIVDKNAALVRRAIDMLDVQGVAGFASYPDVLERAGAHSADMIIAATYSDEVNMVVCQIAHSVFKIYHKIARLRSRSYLGDIRSDLYIHDHLPIDAVISPEHEVADAVLKRLSIPAAFETETFLDGQVQMLGVVLAEDCPVLNTPLRHLSDLFPTLQAVVVGVRRKGRLFAPEPDDQLFGGDMCYLFTPKADVPRTLEIFGKTQSQQRHVVIVGGGTVGLLVAHKLEQSAQRVRTRVIERDRKVAERTAESLERTIVLNGDGLDMALLSEAMIEQADAILTVTDDDKTNLLAAVQGRAQGCAMAIALINDPALRPLMQPLGIDAYVNPRSITVSSILRYIRRGHARRVYSIGDAEAEIIEAEVHSTSMIAGQEVRKIDFPEGVLIGNLRKQGRIHRPTGDMRIEAGDVITIFAIAADVPEVERQLRMSTIK